MNATLIHKPSLQFAELPAPTSLQSHKPGWALCAATAALAAVLMAGRPSSPAPLELSQSDFEERVLQASTPVLVMFDVVKDCHCAEEELLQLRGQWAGTIAVYALNAADSPGLASRYGAQQHVTAMLFDKGRLAKREAATAMVDRVEARHDGTYTSAGMLAELEYFVKHS